MPLPLMWASLLLSGCLDSILEAPYVLTAGMGEARGLSPTSRTTLMIATADGVMEVDGAGHRTVLSTIPAQAVATHRRYMYVLTDEGLMWGDFPPPGQRAQLVSVPIEDVVDLQSWCDGQVLLAGPTGLRLWNPEEGSVHDFSPGLPPLTAVSLLPLNPCSGALVLSTDGALILAERDSHEVLLSGLVHPRAIAADRYGYIWLVHGEPPVLSRFSDGALETRARYLGDPRDLHFGVGELLAPDNAYLADGSGTLDYARVAVP